MSSRCRGRKALALACLVLWGVSSSLAWAADSVAPMADDPILVGAGGIASCDTPGDEATAALIDKMPDDATVFTAGDNAYDHGTATEFAKCYDKTWGRFKDRTHPAPGNHDAATASAGPYYSYFGSEAGKKGDGWYSYDLDAWHIVSLNSLCSHNTRCAPDSPQVRWLKADLAAHPTRCTAAVIHHPLFSSDTIDGDRPEVRPLWDVLYAAGADLIVSGHARVYERHAPQTPSGVADPEYGLPLINVGTGGRGHSSFDAPVANSVVRDKTSWGVLKLTLHDNSFDFAFVPVAGAKFSDSGSRACHGKPGGGEPGGGEPGGQSGGGDPGSGGGETTQHNFSAAADATVVKASPTTNYGSSSTLLTDGSPVYNAYVRFAVSGVEGTVTGARLRLWAADSSSNGPAVYPTTLGLAGADPPWSESAITWNKRPGRTGAALDDLGLVTRRTFVDIDVSDAVRGNGGYSFELASTYGDGSDFASGEVSTSSQRPELIVDVTPPPAEDPPAEDPPASEEPPVTEPTTEPPAATEPEPPAA